MRMCLFSMFKWIKSLRKKNRLVLARSQGGANVDVALAECATCKNYFWFPNRDNADGMRPGFCPYCGIPFLSHKQVDNIEIQ